VGVSTDLLIPTSRKSDWADTVTIGHVGGMSTTFLTDKKALSLVPQDLRAGGKLAKQDVEMPRSPDQISCLRQLLAVALNCVYWSRPGLVWVLSGVA
jgi:hypothetical protein